MSLHGESLISAMYALFNSNLETKSLRCFSIIVKAEKIARQKRTDKDLNVYNSRGRSGLGHSARGERADSVQSQLPNDGLRREPNHG